MVVVIVVLHIRTPMYSAIASKREFQILLHNVILNVWLGHYKESWLNSFDSFVHSAGIIKLVCM